MSLRAKFVLAAVLGFMCGARLAMADDIYARARPDALPARTIRLDVTKKHVTPPLTYSLGRRCPPEVPARQWLTQQLARIDTLTISATDIVLNMSDGREVHADSLLGPTPRDASIQGFWKPTTRVTFYTGFYGKTAIVSVKTYDDDGAMCGESWTMPVMPE